MKNVQNSTANINPTNIPMMSEKEINQKVSQLIEILRNSPDIDMVQQGELMRQIRMLKPLSQSEIGEMVNKSTSHVSNCLSLAALPNEAKSAVQNGKLAATSLLQFMRESRDTRGKYNNEKVVERVAKFIDPSTKNVTIRKQHNPKNQDSSPETHLIVNTEQWKAFNELLTNAVSEGSIPEDLKTLTFEKIESSVLIQEFVSPRAFQQPA